MTAACAALPARAPASATTNFIVRIPARFLKDATISSDAKALRAVLGAFADGRTGRSYVKPSTLEALLGWGEDRRLAAQRELVERGWLRLERKRPAKGRWGARVFILVDPPLRDLTGPVKSRHISLTTL